MNFFTISARFRPAHVLPAGALAVVLAAFGAGGAVATVAGVLLWVLLGSVHTGLEISADRQRSREYRTLLGRRVGRWQPLSPVVGVTLKYYSTVAKAGRPNALKWGI